MAEPAMASPFYSAVSKIQTEAINSFANENCLERNLK